MSVAPPNATITIEGGNRVARINGNMQAYTVLPGRVLHPGSRFGGDGVFREIESYALDGVLGANVTFTGAFNTSFAGAPFFIADGPGSIGELISADNRMMARLELMFGPDFSISGGSQTLPLRRGPGSGTATRIQQYKDGSLTFQLVQRTVGGKEVWTFQASPDGSALLDALELDRATGTAKWRVAEGSVASAATCDISAPRTGRVVITGTNTINSLGTTPNEFVFLRFTGVLTLTYNATSLKLEGGANIVTAPDDTALAWSDGSGNYRVINYRRAAVAPGGASFTAAEKTRLLGLTSGPSLNPNGNFESGLTGWGFGSPQAGGGGNLVTAADAPNGGSYITVDKGTTGTSVGSPYAICDLFPVRGGAVFDVAGLFKGDVAGGASSGRVSINWYKGDGTTAASTASTNNVLLSDLPTAWTLSTGQVTAPADAAYARVLVFLMNTAAARVMSLDLISVSYAIGTTGLQDKAVTLAKLADAGAASLVGATAAGAHADLTAAQARTVLGLATGDSPTFAGATFTGPPRVPSYTVSTLPTPGVAGRIVHASNGRAYDNAGTLEAAAAGTGCLVMDNGTAWKVPGRNVTVSA